MLVVYVFSWEDVVDNEYFLKLSKENCRVIPSDDDAVERLRCIPANWSSQHDEDLAQFLCANTETSDNANLGSIKDYVESVDVSSQSVSASS